MSETRLKILRALKERNKTLSELSRELGLSKPSIYRHLIILKSQGLVRRIKNRNKFMYYALIKSGERLIDLIISALISYVFAYLLAINASREVLVHGKAGVIPRPATYYIGYQYCDYFLPAFALAFILLLTISFFAIRLIRLKMNS